MINLNQKVKVVLSPGNMLYYKEKGYNIDSLKNKAGKIPKGSSVLVNLSTPPKKTPTSISGRRISHKKNTT